MTAEVAVMPPMFWSTVKGLPSSFPDDPVGEGSNTSPGKMAVEMSNLTLVICTPPVDRFWTT